MTSASPKLLATKRQARLRRSLRLLVVLVLLGVIVFAAFPVAQSLRAAYHFRRAEQALAAEELDEAGSHLAVCLELDPNCVRFHLRAAQGARRSALYDLAAEHLEACEQLGDSSDALLLEGAMLSFQRGKMTSYTEQFLLNAVARDCAETVLVLEALARGYLSVYALEHALRCLDQWLERRPDSVQARLHRGWVYERLDRPDDAQNDYFAIVKRRPDHTAATLRLAQVLLQRGQSAEALPWFERLSQRPEQRRVVRLGLARCLADLGRTDEARPLLEELAGEAPAEPAVLFELGKLELSQERAADAEPWLRQAAALAPHDYQTRYQFFLCLRRLGKGEEANRQEKDVNALTADLQRMNDLTNTLRTRPDDPQLRCRIGQLFLRRGEEREGVRRLSDVLRLHPDYPAAHQILADYYQSKGDTRRAADHRRHVHSVRE